MNWQEAIIACKKLGPEWRLPTKDELYMLYKNKEEIGGFAYSTYWSSTENVNGDAWVQDFFTGLQFYNLKNYTYYVRAVRAS